MSGMIWFLHICGFSSSWGDIWRDCPCDCFLLIVKIPSCQGVFDKHWRSASSRISPHCHVPHTSTRCRYQRDLKGMPTYLNTKTPQVKNSEELLSGWIFDDNSVTHSTLYPAAQLEAAGEQPAPALALFCRRSPQQAWLCLPDVGRPCGASSRH